MNSTVEVLSPTPAEVDVAGLIALLRDAVEGGASVGFMLPVIESKLAAFWRDVFADIVGGRRIVLIARDHGRIVGTVQLAFSLKDNSPHRAELQKLLVLRSHRGRGLATGLMHAVEAAARAQRRSLIVLDTSASGNALGVYDRCGYTRVGVIPGHSQDPDGPFINTMFYYKSLAPERNA